MLKVKKRSGAHGEFNANSNKAICAAVVLGTVGASTILIMPGLLGVIVDILELNDRQLGFVASVEVFVMALATGASAILIGKMNWRYLAVVGLLLMIAGNAASMSANSYTLMLWIRALAGIGGGILIAVSFAALGMTRDPDRSFGVYLFFGLMFSAITLYLIPSLIVFGGHHLFFGLLILLCVINLFFLPWLSPCAAAPQKGEGGSLSLPYRLIGIGCVMVTLYFIAQGAVWSYLERMGVAQEIDAQTVANALALSALAGIMGAGIAMLLGNRAGRFLPITVGVIVQIGSMILLNTTLDVIGFIVAVMMFNFSWNLCQPYFSGLMSELDVEGRAVVLMGSIQTVGVAIGPFIAALVIRPGYFDAINYLGILCVSGALLSTYLLLFLKQRGSLQQPFEQRLHEVLFEK